MQNEADTKTYRKLLAQRNGKCFSEAEVTNILEQIFSQLSLHYQEYPHGGLSLDTLAQHDDRVVLLSPTNTSPQPSISQDIYNSGLIAIELLTAKTPAQLRNSDNSWNWEDDCFISDRLTGILNGMLSESPPNRFKNANEVLSALNSSTFFTPPPPSIHPPTFENKPVDKNRDFNKVEVPRPNNNSNVTNIPVQPAQISSSKSIQQKSKVDIPFWQLGLIGLTSTVMVVGVGLGIWKLIEPEAPMFSYLNRSESSPISNNENALFPIQKDGKRGYIDKTGKVLINPNLNMSFAIVDGILDIDGKCNTNESIALAKFTPKFNRSAAIKEGLILIEVNGKCGYIDKKGKVLINPQFDDAGSFSEGLAAVKLGDRYGYIDKTGQSIINPQFLLARPFTEGLAAVNIGSKVGYIDRTGKLVINPQFEWAREFSEGLAVIKVDNKYGYVDINGVIIIPPQFGLALNFSEGLAPVQVDDKWGYIDRTGNFKIEAQFHTAYIFAEGVAVACSSEKNCGYIDKTGKFAINPQFSGASYFSDGLASVSIENQWGYIDKAGRFVSNPQFDWAGDFNAGLALIKVGDKWGYIDKNGKVIWQPSI